MKTIFDCSGFAKICKALLIILILNTGFFASASAQGFATIDFHQAANQSHPTDPIDWINGILNPNNSDYFEGHGVPQRIIFTGIEATPGDTHALNFRHQALKSGVHAYDFLMGWDQAILTTAAIAQGSINELLNLMAQQCDDAISTDGLDACTSATNILAVEVPDNMGDPSGVSCGFPPPLSVNPVITCFEGIFGNRFIHVAGNLPVTWGELIFTGYTGSVDVYATYMLRWHSASDQIKIMVAGRSSQSCNTAGCCGYGSGCGAGSVSGGPYHFILDDFDDVETGNQDNQLQATPAPDAPVCDSLVISGPDSVCPGETGLVYTATYNGTCTDITHSWSITGSGTIVGSTTGASITVDAGSTCDSQFTICDTIVCDEGQVVCCRTITVDDNVNPVITCPNPAASVECPNAPDFGPATATDDCDASPTIGSSDVTTPGSCAQEFSVTRTWTATDDCGNSSTCSRTISVTDNTPPVITCPEIADTINCPAPVLFSVATASDLCDTSVEPTFSDVTTSSGCPFTLTRTWTATDDCGNSSTCSRSITVQDTTPPDITCPTVSDVECPGTPSFGAATADDDCDNSVTPTFSSVTTPGACTQEFSVTRTWTATDDCGNSSTCSRTISVTDNTPPVITCPTVSDVECPGTPDFGSATATDLCDLSVTPTSSDVSTPGSCPQEYSITRTWTATDDCGNSSACSSTISVTDNTPPTLTCAADDTVDCGDAIVFTDPTPSDACDPDVSFAVISTSDTTYADGSEDHCTTWEATDDCGNTAQCTQCIHVNACPSDLFCGYTQGFWGNPNGLDCTGQDKLLLINSLLTSPLVIGCGGNTMTFGVGEGQCVIDRLPAGGTAAAITGNNTCNNIVGIPLYGDGRFRNILLGQTVALELNVRYDANLANLAITGQYMTTIDAEPCDTPNAAPVGSPSVFTIPQSVITYLGANNTVADLLQLANDALCGAYVPSTGNPSLSDIVKALDAFNRGFDECRFLVGFSNTLRADAQVISNDSPIRLTAYPNPFNTSTMISFSIYQSYDNLKLEIFNATGEVVDVPFNGSVNAGTTYTVEFSGINYPAGVYIYRISAGHETYYDKLLLIK